MLSKKIAFVTGSNGGIGKAIVKSLAKNNAKIICAVRKKDKKFINFAKRYKKNIIDIIEFDITNESQVKKKIEYLYKKKKSINILINCAGKASGSITEMTPIKLIKNIFDINFFSQIRITQHLLKFLKKSKNSSIINVGSISGLTPERGNLAYGTSKSALMFASKIMANEFGSYKIRVNSVAPGIIKTKMLEKMDKKIIQKIKNNSFNQKIGTAEEVADLITYLCSDKASHINGQTIKIDGGTIF